MRPKYSVDLNICPKSVVGLTVAEGRMAKRFQLQLAKKDTTYESKSRFDSTMNDNDFEGLCSTE